MKAVNIYFEDKEIERLEVLKGNESWHDFFIKMLEKYEANTK